MSVVACGGTQPATADAGTSSNSSSLAGTNSLSGSFAFTVGSAALDPTIGMDECNFQAALPNGSYATLGIVMTSWANACTATQGNPTSGSAIVIQLASTTYSTTGGSTDAQAAPIALGPHTIDYEGEDDEDLCMLDHSGSSAIVQVIQFVSPDSGADPIVAIGASGTVTLDALDATHAAGSFDVMLAPWKVGPDTAHQVPLSGTFDAMLCP
jgi:hypothetical protein